MKMNIYVGELMLYKREFLLPNYTISDFFQDAHDHGFNSTIDFSNTTLAKRERLRQNMYFSDNPGTIFVDLPCDLVLRETNTGFCCPPIAIDIDIVGLVEKISGTWYISHLCTGNGPQVYFSLNPKNQVLYQGTCWCRKKYPYANYINVIQRAYRKHFIRRKNAAKIITNGCHNWVFAPKCKDGKTGIRPRLDTQYLFGTD